MKPMITELVWLLMVGGRACIALVEWAVQATVLIAKLLWALTQVIVGLTVFVVSIAALAVWGGCLATVRATRWGVRGVVGTIRPPEQ